MANSPAAAPTSGTVFEVADAVCKTGITHSGALIEAMVALLADHHRGFDAATACKAVFAREAEAPTFIASGIAMPHARLDGIEKPLVAVATSEQGISFANTSDKAKLVFLVLTPKCAPAAYIKIAAAVARRIKEPGFLDAVLTANESDDLLAIFENGAPKGHAQVCAADMMSPPAAVLRETNSVKDALDTIVKTGLAEIPVVDKDGDLVGVASARALLSICIPEYLLWMEDLSLFSNFEPFETLLRKEASTWLADITDDDYASVTVDQPAMSVAEAMARHKSERCFVLDGAKLAGVVTLPSFLNNVFRD